MKKRTKYWFPVSYPKIVSIFICFKMFLSISGIQTFLPLFNKYFLRCFCEHWLRRWCWENAPILVCLPGAAPRNSEWFCDRRAHTVPREVKGGRPEPLGSSSWDTRYRSKPLPEQNFYSHIARAFDGDWAANSRIKIIGSCAVALKIKRLLYNAQEAQTQIFHVALRPPIQTDG